VVARAIFWKIKYKVIRSFFKKKEEIFAPTDEEIWTLRTFSTVQNGEDIFMIAEEIAYKFLNRVKLAEKAKSYPSSLSGGQRQRVAIIRGLSMNPKLMLFDEPTSALDPELIGDVLTLMEELSNEGMTMVVITHELGFAENVADRVVFFNEGKIIEEGETKKMIHNPDNARTREFMGQISLK